MMAIKKAYRSGFDHNPGWCIVFDYDLDKIEALKAAVPWNHRSWNEHTKTWWISREYEAEVLALFPDFEAYKSQVSMF
jgi:hypothetical protein